MGEFAKKRDLTGSVVAVTGGAGFIGSHLVDLLVEDCKCHVVVVDDLSVGKKEWVHPAAKLVRVDITQEDTNSLQWLLQYHKVQYVFGLAAIPFLPDCYENPQRVFDVNAVAALRVMEAAHKVGVRGILQVSSAEVYDQEGLIIEDSPTCARSTYGASKLAVDYLVQCRWREAGVPVLAVRQLTACGPRESHSYIIPEIISQLSRWREDTGMYGREVVGAPKVKLGANTTRDFSYVGDVVKAQVELMEHGDGGNVYNLGSGVGTHIYDLVPMVAKAMGIQGEVRIETDPSRFRRWEIQSIVADCTKLHSTIPHRPRVGLQEAIQRTVDYHRECGGKWVWE